MATPKKKTAKSLKKTPAKKAVKKISPAKKQSSQKRTISRGAAAATAQKITLDDVYLTDGSGKNITLAIKVGDKGQTSDMTIKLDDNVIVQNYSGDLESTSLGSNNQLNGKQLSIVANIADTSRETNVTSLKIQLRGGLDPKDFPLTAEVEQEGASVDYLCLIEFM